MSTANTPRTETLVAIDWNDQDRQISKVVDFIRAEGGYDAMIEARPFDHTKPNGEVVGGWRVVFNADRVRNTEVHGAGYRAGFVVHIEQAS